MNSTPDPYSDLARAYHHLARRPPAWAAQLAPDDGAGLDAVMEAIRAGGPDFVRSDATIRALAGLARRDPSAATVLLHALAPKLRQQLSRAATAEYRGDALTELAIVILENDLDGVGLARRLVNRAHTRTYKHERRIRHHGTTTPMVVDPCPPDWLANLHDSGFSCPDIAVAIADRVDLEQFTGGVHRLVANGGLTAGSWRAFVDHRLAGALHGPGVGAPTRQRVAAHRAARHLAPLIAHHLEFHAA